MLFPSDPKEKKKVANLEYCYSDMENGILSEPSEFEGERGGQVTSEIIEYAVKKGFAKKASHYHLRDWLISRQRYWGAPIPMVYCPKDGWQPVAEEDLPVLLPYIENFKPLGTGVAPLAQDEKFVNAKCPVCQGSAKRETDVCDTFLDSSWYFLRYPVSNFDSVPFASTAWKSKIKNQNSKAIGNLKLEIGNSAKRARWLPVPMYIGGAEHSVLHLLYSRFITKVLFDQKLIDFDEPFTKFRAHGLLIKDGAKMSKSRGNVINPDNYIKRFGADTLRCYLMFLGPFNMGGDFRDSGIEGMERFLKRVRRLVESNLASALRQAQGKKNQSGKKSAKNYPNLENEKSINRAIKEVGEDVENLRYNTALAKIMELVNDLIASKDTIDPKYLRTLLILLGPFAPYLSEELWERLRLSGINTDETTDSRRLSVHVQKWPEFDQTKLEEEDVNIAVQVNGKLRAVLKVENSNLKVQSYVEDKARADQKISKYLEGKQVKKVIYVPGKIINFVV